MTRRESPLLRNGDTEDEVTDETGPMNPVCIWDGLMKRRPEGCGLCRYAFRLTHFASRRSQIS